MHPGGGNQININGTEQCNLMNKTLYTWEEVQGPPHYIKIEKIWSTECLDRRQLDMKFDVKVNVCNGND